MTNTLTDSRQSIKSSSSELNLAEAAAYIKRTSGIGVENTRFLHSQSITVGLIQLNSVYIQISATGPSEGGRYSLAASAMGEINVKANMNNEMTTHYEDHQVTSFRVRTSE